MKSESSTLAEALPIEQERCRELLEGYKSIPTGKFGAMMIEAALKRAEKAAAEGDTVAMLRAYNELKECQ